VWSCEEVQTAAAMVHELASEAERLLRRGGEAQEPIPKQPNIARQPTGGIAAFLKIVRADQRAAAGMISARKPEAVERSELLKDAQRVAELRP